MYFVFLYENRAMNAVEIVLIRGKGLGGQQWKD
jgi:hypothetical protein